MATTSPSSQHKKWHVCGHVYLARTGAEAVGMYLGEQFGYRIKYKPETDETLHWEGAAWWLLVPESYNPRDYEEWVAEKQQEAADGNARAEAEVARMQASRGSGTT